MALANRISALNELYMGHLHSRPVLTLTATAGALGLIPLFRYLVASYRGFMALGEGGIPHNVFGWIIQGLMQTIASRDLTTPAPYRNPKMIARFEPYGRQSFLRAPLPERAGPAPVVPKYVAPQRQTTEQIGPEMQERMRAFMESVASSNINLFEVKSSLLEGAGTPAMHLRKGQGQAFMALGMLKGETVHIHPEGSSHATVSLKDAEEVVTKGWGQRHPLSGRGNIFPSSYVMIYAPRNEDEFEVWKGLVKASASFVSGAQKIEG